MLGKQTRRVLDKSLGQVTAPSFLIGKAGVKLGPAFQSSLAWVMRDDLYKVPEVCVIHTREVYQKLNDPTGRTNTEFPTVPVDYQEAEPYRRAAHQSTSFGRMWCSSSKLLLLPSSHPAQLFSASSSVGERCRTSFCYWVSVCPSLSYEGILIGFRA